MRPEMVTLRNFPQPGTLRVTRVETTGENGLVVFHNLAQGEYNATIMKGTLPGHKSDRAGESRFRSRSLF